MNRTARRIGSLAVLLCLIILHGCARESGPGKLHVVASIEPLAWFVDRIGGSKVSVSVMVPPGGNPHSYEPTPNQMVRLGDAALFVKAGSGVEFEIDWMPRFLDLNRTLAVCDASAGVRFIPMKQPDIKADAGSMGAAHRHGYDDPHYWLSPQNGRLIAANVERSLAAADPRNRAYYEANLMVLDRELQALDRDIRSRLLLLKNRRFLVFHPAWGYFAKAYGLQQVAAEDEGKTLTPVEMTRVIDTARTNRIRVVFVSPQFSTTQAEAIARDIGGTTSMIDPLSRDYPQNLLKATEAFARSMK